MAAMGSINQVGILSGIGSKQIDQMVSARSGQLQRLQGQQSEAEGHKKLFQELNGQLGSIMSAVQGLNDADIFHARSASTSDSAVTKVSATSDAPLGSYGLDVSNLAQAHSQVVGTADGTADGTVTQGVADTDDSTAINDGVTVSFFHEGTEHTYTTDSSTTLASLAERINSDGNGVKANVTNIDDTGTNPQYVMTLQSETIGGGTQQITTDSGGTSPGVSVSGGSLFTAGDEQEVAQSGKNAHFTVDGVSYTRSSNSVDDVIDGVTLNLQGTGQATIDVTHDTGAAADKVQEFVDTYNKAVESLSKQTAYDAENKKAGPLTGDATARGVQRTLRTMVSGSVETGDSNPLETLSQVGIRVQRDGTLEFDEGDFEDELSSNPGNVEDLFVGEDRAAGRMEAEMEGLTQTGSGVVPSKIDSLDNRMDRLDDAIQAERSDLQQYRERLFEKYSNLDKLMASFEQQKSAMKASLSQLSSL